MTQAILAFNLPEDQESYEIYCNAENTYNNLLTLAEEIRKELKYSNNTQVSLDSLYQRLNDIIYACPKSEFVELKFQ